jgi:D-serine deaminase-like pyridoxal phosphate-dependent protein
MRIEDVETPAVLVDLDLVEANIRRAQSLFDQLGKGFRPDITAHKIPFLAGLQMQAGAIGIACQNILEAEGFAADFDDILLCSHLLSPRKIARARPLAEAGQLTVVADNPEVVAALSCGMAGTDLPMRVLVECDTGMGRCGVQSPEAARDLARAIAAAPGLEFGGLMTCAAPQSEARVEAFLSAAAALCLPDVGPCRVISTGGTPSLALVGLTPSITEYRAGTYIYNDRALVARGACTVDDCALTILTTVVSRPTPDRAILDAGSNSLSSEVSGLKGYGMIPAYPRATITGLGGGHGHVDLHQCPTRPRVGEKLQVIPNHAGPVSNLIAQVILHRSGAMIRPAELAARG